MRMLKSDESGRLRALLHWQITGKAFPSLQCLIVLNTLYGTAEVELAASL